jgi:predicted metal-binding membrane protein
MSAVARLRARKAGLPLVVALAIAAAWALAIAAQLAGDASKLHHDALIHSSLPHIVGLMIFLVAWQAMIAAMMLPSSLPLISLFARTSAAQPQPGRVMASFLGGYVAVWTGFGAIAFIGDLGIHTTVDSVPWLSRHDWLIAAATLTLAGAFQFTSLKDACLRECRHPAAFLLSRYDRGADAAFRLGRAHGLYCLGCCWALMLVMFGAGVASLWWMAVLTALMVYEKTAPKGRRAVPVAGVAFLALGALTFIQPGWLPSLSV